MQFFLSPSKTMHCERRHETATIPQFAHQAAQIRAYLAAYTQEQLATQFRLSQKQVEQVQEYYQMTQPVAAIDLYQGIVFQQLQPEHYTKAEREYLAQHVRILSAVYGSARPFDALLPYRLDLKQVLPELGESLTGFWQRYVQEELADQCCINLASQEFAKLLPKSAITIDFVESYEDEKPKRLATYAKMARGQFLDACIRHQVSTLAQLQAITTQRYKYCAKYSTPTCYVYLKKTTI